METIFCRYSQQNVSMSSLSKPYASDVPQFLHNRPRQLISHCLESIQLSSTISKKQIAKKDTSTYLVKGSQQYQVDMAAPSCSCLAWCMSSYPCKHMFAVTHHYGENLPDNYLSNPWFTLDRFVVGNSVETSSLPTVTDLGCDLQTHEADLETSDCGNIQSLEPSDVQVDDGLPSRKSTKTVCTTIRENLNVLRSLSYLLTDEEKIYSLDTAISQLILECRTSVKTEDGLPLESDKKTKCQPTSSDATVSLLITKANFLSSCQHRIYNYSIC